MALSFPASPSVNDTYTEASRTWKWNGTTWKVVTSVINAGSVSAAELASSAVTEAKIANSAVTADKIGSSAVTEAKIASGAVTAAKIASSVWEDDQNIISTAMFV